MERNEALERINAQHGDKIAHEGWFEWRFWTRNREWVFLTIDTDTRKYCSIRPNDRERNGFWPHWQSLCLDSIIDVLDAAKLVERMYGSFDLGEVRGAQVARADIRSALGIK